MTTQESGCKTSLLPCSDKVHRPNCQDADPSEKVTQVLLDRTDLEGTVPDRGPGWSGRDGRGLFGLRHAPAMPVVVRVLPRELVREIDFGRLASLSQANIVRLLGFGREGPIAFVVTDVVGGTTLRDRLLDLEGNPLPSDETSSILDQLCTALDYAHGKEQLHGGIEPGRVLLTDFGLARADAAGIQP